MFQTAPGDYKPAPVLERGEAGLRQLAELLEHEQAWRDRWKWDFGIISKPLASSCGTAGCALGLAVVTWPEQVHIADPLGDLQRVVNADGEQHDWMLDTFMFAEPVYGCDFDSVTPGMVAARIRERVGYG